MKSFFTSFQNRSWNPGQPRPVRPPFGQSGGTIVTAENSKKVSAFNRGVVYLSTQIAKLPWHIKDSDNNIVTGHRIDSLLNITPNDEMTSFDFKILLIQNAIIWGNGYAEIERDMAGRVKALWPIDSRDVDLHRRPDGGLVYRITGGSGSITGTDVYLRPEEIFHIKNFTTLDGLVGQGVVGYAIDTLGIARGSDIFANSLYSNGGMPSGVLEVPGTLSDEAFKRVKESWDKQHGGRKTGSTAVLEEGMRYNPVSFQPDVLQFLESRKFTVQEMARFLGVPPTKLYDSEAATYNNIEHSNLEVVMDTLDPWTRNLESEVDWKLLRKRFGGYKSEFDLTAVMRGDMDTRATYFQKMMQSAAMTPNQIRQKEGMPPYQGGDRYFVASNNFTPADRIDEVIDSQVKPQNPAPAQNENEDDGDEDELTRAVTAYVRKKTRN